MPAQVHETLVIEFSGEHKSGRRLFDGLLEANSTSFWNHSFMAAINSLKYTGFVRPATLFLSAPSHHLESIRSAYAKRMLKAPAGVAIASLGEMGAMRPVAQLHFVPLSDAFCDAVAALNRVGRAATMGSVRDQIARQCSQLAPPTQEMLAQTATALAKEGLVARVGQHMFVTPAPPKTTVECQTGDSMMVPDAKEERRERKKEGILARLFTRKITGSPCKKRASPVPAPAGNILPDWECNELENLTPQAEYRPAVYSTRPRTSVRHHHAAAQQLKHAAREATRETRQREARAAHRAQHQHQHGYHAYRTSSDEELQYPPSMATSSSQYPATHYGPIDPPESIERYHREKQVTRRGHHHHHQQRQELQMPLSVPIPSKARASTPTTSDSAYSRSTSDHSDEAEEEEEVDHTYVNIRSASQLEETHFEECSNSLWNGPATPVVTVM